MSNQGPHRARRWRPRSHRLPSHDSLSPCSPMLASPPSEFFAKDSEEAAWPSPHLLLPLTESETESSERRAVTRARPVLVPTAPRSARSPLGGGRFLREDSRAGPRPPEARGRSGPDAASPCAPGEACAALRPGDLSTPAALPSDGGVEARATRDAVLLSPPDRTARPRTGAPVPSGETENRGGTWRGWKAIADAPYFKVRSPQLNTHVISSKKKGGGEGERERERERREGGEERRPAAIFGARSFLFHRWEWRLKEAANQGF